MARPRLPDGHALVRLTICVRPQTADAIYRVASQRRELAGPLTRRILERVFGMLEHSSSVGAWYSESRHLSTAQSLVSRDAEPASPHAVVAR